MLGAFIRSRFKNGCYTIRRHPISAEVAHGAGKKFGGLFDFGGLGEAIGIKSRLKRINPHAEGFRNPGGGKAMCHSLGITVKTPLWFPRGATRAPATGDGVPGIIGPFDFRLIHFNVHQVKVARQPSRKALSQISRVSRRERWFRAAHWGQSQSGINGSPINPNGGLDISAYIFAIKAN